MEFSKIEELKKKISRIELELNLLQAQNTRHYDRKKDIGDFSPIPSCGILGITGAVAGAVSPGQFMKEFKEKNRAFLKEKRERPALDIIFKYLEKNSYLEEDKNKDKNESYDDKYKRIKTSVYLDLGLTQSIMSKYVYGSTDQITIRTSLKTALLLEMSYDDAYEFFLYCGSNNSNNQNIVNLVLCYIKFFGGTETIPEMKETINMIFKEYEFSPLFSD